MYTESNSGLRISGFCEILRFWIRIQDIKYAVLPGSDFSDIVFLYEKKKKISKRQILLNNEKICGCFLEMLLATVSVFYTAVSGVRLIK